MGKGDRRNTQKMKARKSRAKHKARSVAKKAAAGSKPADKPS